MEHAKVHEWAAGAEEAADASGAEAGGQLLLRLALAAALGVALVTAVVGNFMLLFVLLKFGRLRRVHNLSYMSLCCSDLLAVLLCLPASGALLVYSTRPSDGRPDSALGAWRLDAEALCAPWLGALLAFALASVLSICSIALGMYLRIQNPYQYRQLLNRMTGIGLVVLIWLLALIGAGLPPQLLSRRVYTLISMQSAAPIAPVDADSLAGGNESTREALENASASEKLAAPTHGLCFYQLSHVHAVLLVGLGFCVPGVLLVVFNGIIFRFSRQQYTQICRSYYSQLNLVIGHSVSMPHSLNQLAVYGNQLVSRYGRISTSSYSQQPSASVSRASHVNRAESLQQRNPPLFLNIRRRSQEKQGAKRQSNGRCGGAGSSAVSPMSPPQSQAAAVAATAANGVGTSQGAGSNLKRGSTATDSSTVSNLGTAGAQSAAHRSSMADMPGPGRPRGLKAARTLGTITLSFLYAYSRVHVHVLVWLWLHVLLNTL